MYLKSIKSSGFKSFADKIDLEINSGITGIVGPNGSGKSNIVDAIRWVLGEQSVKALRGDSLMSDVIFSGSKSREAATRSMVSLAFDNSDHYLNSEFNELEIKRILYRNGDNEFYLNNTKVRLKDITDLFTDSGAGKGSFNIISQGAVTDIVNSKPYERRVIFEEAAGVLKYKKRKEETLKKLEKAKINLDKVELVIKELSDQLEPLKKQAEVAKKYLDYNASLKNIEISLIAKDITEMNIEYKNLKDRQEQINSQLEGMALSNNQDIAKMEMAKLNVIKLDEEINSKSADLIKMERAIADLEAKKQLITERKKYEVDDIKLENNILNLKEEQFTINKNITTLSSEIDGLKSELQQKVNIKNKMDDDILNLTHKHYSLSALINAKNKEIMENNNKIDIMEKNIEENAKEPYAVRVILNNPRFNNVYGTLSSLINTDDKFVTAINTSLGSNCNVLVVDNPNTAKECINYLKENAYGRATFFPISVIKERFIDSVTLAKINETDGFINVASNLVDYEDKYTSIIKNQLGNIIVVDNIDSLNKIGKLIDYKYKIVTLDGEVLYAGGAITGGTLKKDLSVIKQKQELNAVRSLIEQLNGEVKKLNIDDEDTNNSLNKLNSNLHDMESSIINLNENILQKNKYLNDLQHQFDEKKQELDGTENVKNSSLDAEINRVLKEFYQKSTEKELQIQNINKLKNQKEDINLEIKQFEENNRLKNTNYNKMQNELKNIEVNLAKMDVKMDNYLATLNENYNITFEHAVEISDNNINILEAKNIVNSLKNKIKDLGEINTGSINEFARINERYTFLTKQQNDLSSSINELLNIINDMDNIMINKFQETFSIVASEFGKVFKALFKGGIGKLILTDASNLLETGVDIIAEPPGKKLNSIALLSGGEKTLTAIALLFAILNVKPVPFVVLDEVEAALDDANVETFGKYLLTKKDKSQFIIITHKKKTMEYADTLYGITMQESGVSKLVSVKLEN